MNLRKVTNKNLIFLDCDFHTKKEVIEFLVEKLYEENKIESKEGFLKAVMEREALSETGISDGLAIPHGKNELVKEAAFAAVRVKQPVEDWESLDENNRVTLIFLLAIPMSQAGDTHLELLAELMTKAQDAEFLQRLKDAETVDEFYDDLNRSEEVKEQKEKEYDKMVVAVTACPAGIAHTYMAAEALVKAGEKMGVKVYVEKQGANGVEDRHTKEHLKNADAAIFAVDVAVKESERFQHLPIYRTKVASPIKDAEGVIQAALDKAENEKNVKREYKETENSETSGTVFEDVKSSVLTGISYIIPIIVAGGMINAFAVLLTQGFGLQTLAETEQSWLWCFRQMGSGMLGTIMIPVLSAYMAYSLGDKTALAPGFAAGIAANLIGGGFLCGMLGGLTAGYAVRFLRKAVPAKGTLAGFVSFWVYPVLSTVIVGIVLFFLVGKPVAWLNQALIDFLGSMSGSNGAVLGAILGIMVSFDLGGPVNKAAYTFCVGAMAEGILMPYAAFASVKMVSGFAITAATKIFKNLFSKEEKEIGNSTWILVLAGITEGAIPFMMADPIRVILPLCTGSAVTGAIIGAAGIGLDVPGAGIFSLFLLKNGLGGFMNAAVWFFAAVIGAAVSMALLVVLRTMKIKKAEKK